MFTPSRGKFPEKGSDEISIQTSTLDQKRKCAYCGNLMDIVKRIKTRINFIFPVPGEKHLFKCQKCYQEVIIYSPGRFLLYFPVAIFCIYVLFLLSYWSLFDFLAGHSSTSDILNLLFSFLLLIFPIEVFLDICKRKKYPVVSLDDRIKME